MSIVVGIIGPPCSGKSTIARTIEQSGGTVIDADQIAKSHLSDPDVIAELVSHWGRSILDDAGQISRPAIADLVFADNAPSRENLRLLESILHPRTRAEITQRLQAARNAKTPIIALDVPLLLEVGWDKACDEIWCVQIDPATHRRLIESRGWTLEELDRRTARQLPIAEKEARATRILVNNAGHADWVSLVGTMVDSLTPDGRNPHQNKENIA